jgi:DNA-binding GntR family transcriptional regulator
MGISSNISSIYTNLLLATIEVLNLPDNLEALDSFQIEDRSDIKESVYLKLKQMIMKREFTPNARIDALEIAQKLGISRTPVRDVLNMLHAEGFINIVPRQGVYVKGIYKKDLIELFQFRQMVELYSLEVGFDNLRKEANRLNEIINSVESLLKNPENYDGNKVMNADISLHKIIVDSTENSRIIDSYVKLNAHVQMARAYYLQDLTRIQLSHKEHLLFIHELISGNKEKSLKYLKEHLDQTLNNLLRIIEIYKVF